MIELLQSLDQGTMLTAYGIICYLFGMCIGGFIVWSVMR